MSTTIRYIILIGVGVFMVYPLLWMISATFKDNNEIFSTLEPHPDPPDDGWLQGRDEQLRRRYQHLAGHAEYV